MDMPEWELHNKWAARMGISIEVANYVNSLIDLPEKSPEYLDFCLDFCTDATKRNDFHDELRNKEPLIARAFEDLYSLPDLKDPKKSKSHLDFFCNFLSIGHDTSRSNKLQAYIQLKFLRHRGNEYVKAWYLRHFLDYTQQLYQFPREEILERLSDRIECCQRKAKRI